MSPESPLAHMKGQTPEPEAEKSGEKSQAELRTELEAKLRAMKAPYEAAMEEYKAALKDGTFEDQEGEEEGAGEKRKLALQTKIRGQVERAQGIRHQLDSGEPLTDTADLDTAAIDTYLSGISWIVPEGHAPKGAFTPPTELDWSALAQDRDDTKAGEYTLNPETQGLDFESLRVYIPNLSAFMGKPFHEVMQHVVDTYSATHHIPGIEYWKWLIENPTEDSPNLVKDPNKYYFFPGSTLRDRDGDWDVPFAQWHGTEWDRGARWFTLEWNGFYRVVLLEK